MKILLKVLGCRGSIPRSGKEFENYGGATSSYGIRIGERLVVLDAGTGSGVIALMMAQRYAEAVVEAVDPVVLGCRVCEPRPVCNCCCRSAELPESVSCCVNGALDDREDRRVLLVSLGMFSVIRIERPAQLVVSAGNYAVPDKECRAAESETDPCGLFREMEFPIAEFSPPTQRQLER